MFRLPAHRWQEARTYVGVGLTSACPQAYFTDKLLNREVQANVKTDSLSSTFAALSDPTRRAILARLASGETSVTELAEPFEMSMPAISKHLKVLERAGLIARGRERQWRPARLEAAPLREVADWAERYRRFWEESYDRLDEYLEKLQDRGKEKGHGRKR
jgi:DNA-binding transcriptional ArsR family regulator